MKDVDDRAFDLLIVGGGVFGAAAAREAALNGWSVVLCERGDLAEETSSRSSKLLHGGLRYLERFELGLVREALRERAVAACIAPHLARPLPFLAPLYEGGRVGPFKLKTGLWLYDALAGAKRELRRGYLEADEALKAEPALAAKGLRGAGRYFDFQTLDSRLTAELAVAAAERGATILTRAEVADVSGGPPGLFVATVKDRRPGGGEFRVRAKAVVAAVGPFSDRFRARAAGGARPRTRLTSGVHAVLPGVLREHALVLTARSDGRVFFVIPFEGRTLLGTTDRDFDGDPADPRPEEADLRYLLDEANAALDGAPFRREDVIASFSGLRALARDDSDMPSGTSREQLVFEEPRGVVHVIGGKLTTWRPIARRLVEAAAPIVGKPLDAGLLGATTPLPGASASAATNSEDAAASGLGGDDSWDLGVAPEVRRRLVTRYGLRARDVLRLARDDRSLLEPVAPTIPELRAELAYLKRFEFAETAEDCLRRRLPRLLIDRVAASDIAAATRVLDAAR